MGTHYKGTPRETQTLDTHIKLLRVYNDIISSIKPSLGELTFSQFGVLELLYHKGPQIQGTLGKKILKSSANVVTVVDNLEKRGLVKRERDTHDRRYIMVSLTHTGEELIAKLFPLHVNSLVESYSKLSDEELESLGNLCKKLGIAQS